MLEAIDPFGQLSERGTVQRLRQEQGPQAGRRRVDPVEEIRIRGDCGTVPGSPAAKAGLSTYDMIETIKGVATRDMPLAYAGLLLQANPIPPWN